MTHKLSLTIAPNSICIWTPDDGRNKVADFGVFHPQDDGAYFKFGIYRNKYEDWETEMDGMIHHSIHIEEIY